MIRGSTNMNPPSTMIDPTMISMVSDDTSTTTTVPHRRYDDDDDDDGAEEDDEDDDGPTTRAEGHGVHLGFSVPYVDDDDGDEGEEDAHDSADWSLWDGGRVGGRPSWLNPRDLPSTSSLTCERCSSRIRRRCRDDDAAMASAPRLRFIAQIYCPIDADELRRHQDDDDDDDEDRAFHRTLYVFVCPKCCRDDDDGDDLEGRSRSILVLRGQLPRSNDFYPYRCTPATNDDGYDVDRTTTIQE